MLEFIFDKEQVNWCTSLSKEERINEKTCPDHEDGPWTLKDAYCSHGDCAISKWNKNYGKDNKDPVTSHHDWQGRTINIGGLTFRCGQSSAKYGDNAGCTTKNKWYVVGSEGFDKIVKLNQKNY